MEKIHFLFSGVVAHVCVIFAFVLFLSACVRTATPEDPTPTPEPEKDFLVSVTAVDGLLGKDRVKSAPKFIVIIDAPEANYTISYTLDGEDGCIEKAFPHDMQVITVAGTPEIAKHVLSGKVTRDATGEEVPFSSSVWMRWPELKAVRGALTVLDTCMNFSSSPVTVDKDVVLTVDVAYQDSLTPVKYMAFNGGGVTVKKIEKVMDGHMRMSAVTTEKSDTAYVGMVLVNGNLCDTVKQRIICTGKISEKQHVTDFTVDGIDGLSVSVPMREKFSFSIHPQPATAVDAGEVSVVIGDKNTATVTEQDGVWTITPVWIGATSMKITVGSISKTYSLAVTGTPVSGFSIANVFTSTDWITGTSVSDLIVPIPSDAFDADEMVVKSLTPSVVSVKNGGNGVYTLTALRYGSAEVEVATGHCRKTFSVTVHQNLDLSEINGSFISWGDERSFTVKGNFSGYSIVTSADNSWALSRSGNEISITNTMEKGNAPRISRSVALTLRTADGYSYSATFTLGAVPDNFSSSMKYVSEAEGGSKAVIRLTFANGTGSDVDFMGYQGFLLSGEAASEAHISTACTKLKEGTTLDLYAGSYVYARFYDFLSFIPGLAFDDALVIPAMTVKQYDMTLPFAGDDYGYYKDGLHGVMRSSPDGPSEEWTFWTF